MDATQPTITPLFHSGIAPKATVSTAKLVILSKMKLTRSRWSTHIIFLYVDIALLSLVALVQKGEQVDDGEDHGSCEQEHEGCTDQDVNDETHLAFLYSFGDLPRVLHLPSSIRVKIGIQTVSVTKRGYLRLSRARFLRGIKRKVG